MAKICCFGELLMRLSPDGDGHWLDSNAVPVYVGGAEANVAGALARWENAVSYCTVVPDNYLARQMVGYLQKKNIDTSPVVFSGEKLGIYLLTQGSDLKNAGVIYDRAGSSFAAAKPGTIDWDKVLDQVSLFHFSAISPALSQQAADLCMEGVTAACQKKIPVSLDLNYREKLWKYGKQPSEIMPALAACCTIIMGNVWAAEIMLGIPIDPQLKEKQLKEIYLDQARQSSAAIFSHFPQCRFVANTFRFGQGGVVDYYCALFTENRLHVSKAYHTDAVVDKVGSGDCFMAGLIHGYTHQWDPARIIDFSTAAAFDKLFIMGDATSSSESEIVSAYLQ